MTLPSTPFRKDHTGNGTTGPFLYDWKILSDTHLRIVHQVIATGIETVLVLGVDYSVTGVGNPTGGNVNLTDALPGTEKITILPNVPYEQDTDFTNQNSVKPEEAEEMADKLGRQVKQLVEKMSRAVTLPESSTESPVNYISQMNQIYADTIAAKNTTEAARDSVLNNAGFIVVAADLLGSDTIGTVAADITNVNTTAGSIANVNTVAGSIAIVNIVAADIANVNTVAADIASVNSAAANMAAIIAAPTQAANAASSALLAQSWAVDPIGTRPEGSSKYWSEIAAGFAAAINLPSATGNAMRFLRQKADETGFEYRTGAQVLNDIGAATTAQGAKADTALQPGDATKLTLGTVQASTSGTAIDFTGIPAGTKRITINFSGVSTNGTSHWLIQLGDSGGVETTGYLGSGTVLTGTVTTLGYTAGFGLYVTIAGAVINGSVTLTLLDPTTFTWAASGVLGWSNQAAVSSTAGSKALSAALDRVRITTVNGTDAFDAGKINITYE